MNRSTLEIVVGVASTIVLAGFVTFAFAVNQHKVSGYTVYGVFNRVDGLSLHAEVRVAGIRVGEVLGETYLPATHQARLAMVIDPAYKIPDDSAAIVASDGLFGGKFIKIDPGGSSETIQPGGSFSIVQDSVDFEHILSLIVQNAEAQREAAKAAANKSTAPESGAGEKTPDGTAPPAPAKDPATGKTE
jgi:phospholipid/cholesterol/gamma-HCH transport system substrate-binding protein